MTTNTEAIDQQSRPVTLGQKRANHAWKSAAQMITDVKNAEVVLKRSPNDKRAKTAFDNAKSALDEYAGEAKKLPIRIKASGLGQALAFIHAKSKKSKRSLAQLHEDLSRWVLVDRGMKWTKGDPDWKPAVAAKVQVTEGGDPIPELLLEAVVYGTSDFLRWATDETLSYLQWLNRFLESQVEVDDT